MNIQQRDLIGYGPTPPRGPWPNGARLAVSICLNYEEGAEMAVGDGDTYSELVGEVVRKQKALVRDLAMESQFEYGSRSGLWRMLALFDKRRVPITVFACALAVERNPAFADYLARSPQHEVCCHGYRWEDVSALGADVEREHIHRAVQSLERTVGRRPRGWYCRYRPSVHTRQLLVEEGGFEYDSDSYADDVPYSVVVDGVDWCVVPFAQDTADTKYWRSPSFGTADDFYVYLRDTFDCLYAEAQDSLKMMSVGLHCRTVGRPGRFAAVERFLQHIQAHPDVWVTTRLDIARAWKNLRDGVAAPGERL